MNADKSLVSPVIGQIEFLTLFHQFVVYQAITLRSLPVVSRVKNTPRQIGRRKGEEAGGGTQENLYSRILVGSNEEDTGWG